MAVSIMDDPIEKRSQPDHVTPNGWLEVSQTSRNTDMREMEPREIERNLNLEMEIISVTVILNQIMERWDIKYVLQVHVDALEEGTLWYFNSDALMSKILFESGLELDSIRLFRWPISCGLDRRYIYYAMLHNIARGADWYEYFERHTRVEVTGQEYLLGQIHVHHIDQYVLLACTLGLLVPTRDRKGGHLH